MSNAGAGGCWRYDHRAGPYGPYGTGKLKHLKANSDHVPSHRGEINCVLCIQVTINPLSCQPSSHPTVDSLGCCCTRHRTIFHIFQLMRWQRRCQRSSSTHTQILSHTHTHTHLRPYTTPIGTQEEGDDLLRRLSMTQQKNAGEAGRLWFLV